MSNPLYHRKPDPHPREPAPDKPSQGNKRKPKGKKPFHVLMRSQFFQGPPFTLHRCATRQHAEELREKHKSRFPRAEIWIEEKPGKETT